jgi:hypothetical protein
LIQRLSAGDRVIGRARPKLSANAPMTALMAPLAPTIGVIHAGSVVGSVATKPHWAAAAA